MNNNGELDHGFDKLEEKESYLFKQLQTVRYLAKRLTLDDKLKERILADMKALKVVMQHDLMLALNCTIDLKNIKKLIKEKKCGHLIKQTEILEMKLREMSDFILPDYLKEDNQPKEFQALRINVYQDNYVKLVDSVSKEHMLNKIEECKYILNLVDNVLKLMDIRQTEIPAYLKNDLHRQLYKIKRLLKLDALLMLIMKIDLIDFISMLDPTKPINKQLIRDKLDVMKLKLERCKRESVEGVECQLTLALPGKYPYLEKIDGWSVAHAKDFLSSANRQTINFKVINLKLPPKDDKKKSKKQK